MNKALAGLALALLLATGLCSTASADTVELQLTSGLSTTAVIVGAPCGTDTCVSFSGTVGSWTINLTAGDSGGPTNPTIDLSSLNATSSGSAAALNIELTDNGFTTTGGWTLASSGNLVSGIGTATISDYLDAGNALFSKTTLLGTLGPFSTSYAASSPSTPGGIQPYSLTEDLVLTAGSGGVKWSTDSSIAGAPVAPVPEPSSLAMLGSGLIGLGLLRKLLPA